MEFLSENAGTIIVTLILATIVVSIIMKLNKDKKSGKCVCGKDCGCCSASCHKQKSH